jgi:spore coat protein H
MCSAVLKILILSIFLVSQVSCLTLKETKIDGRNNSEKTKKKQVNKHYNRSSVFFDSDKVHEVKININPDIFENLVLNPYLADGKQIYAYASSIDFNGEVIEHIGVRARGGSSKDNHKRQLKISFNASKTYTDRDESSIVINDEIDNRNLYGVRKLNFRASQNDPAIIREKLSSYIYHMAGAYTTRNGFAKVYINDQYWGFFLISEQIDTMFMRSRFNEKSAPLYKGVHGAAQFDKRSIGRGFELKTKEASRESLSELFGEIESKDIKVIEKYFDIDSVINYLAASTLTGHWDSFVVLGNNDYLYRHTDGKYKIICWDTDNTFGSGRGWNFPMLEKSIFKMASNINHNRLFSVILADSHYRQIYIDKVKYLIDNVYKPDILFPIIDKWQSTIKDGVLADERKHVDWRYPDVNSSNKAWEEGFYRTPENWTGRGFGDYSKGLKGWIEDRYNIVKNELDSL